MKKEKRDFLSPDDETYPPEEKALIKLLAEIAIKSVMKKAREQNTVTDEPDQE